MPEPTIDEMLAWLRNITSDVQGGGLDVRDLDMRVHICAVLEEYRVQKKWESDFNEVVGGEKSSLQSIELEAARAFVERVGVRYASDKLWGDGQIENYLRLMYEELAAMEKESKT